MESFLCEWWGCPLKLISTSGLKTRDVRPPMMRSPGWKCLWRMGMGSVMIHLPWWVWQVMWGSSTSNKHTITSISHCEYLRVQISSLSHHPWSRQEYTSLIGVDIPIVHLLLWRLWRDHENVPDQANENLFVPISSSQLWMAKEGELHSEHSWFFLWLAVIGFWIHRTCGKEQN